MYYQVTKLNPAKSHHDFADKGMPARIITILGIADAVQENSDTGKSAGANEPVVFMQCCYICKYMSKLKMHAWEMENFPFSCACIYACFTQKQYKCKYKLAKPTVTNHYSAIFYFGKALWVYSMACVAVWAFASHVNKTFFLFLVILWLGLCLTL